MRLLAALAIFAASVLAQPIPARGVPSGATLPATCSPSGSNLFIKTAATTGLYQCLTTDTWTAVGAAGGVTTFNTRSAAVAPASGDYSAANLGDLLVTQFSTTQLNVAAGNVFGLTGGVASAPATIVAAAGAGSGFIAIYFNSSDSKIHAFSLGGVDTSKLSGSNFVADGSGAAYSGGIYNAPTAIWQLTSDLFAATAALDARALGVTQMSSFVAGAGLALELGNVGQFKPAINLAASFAWSGVQDFSASTFTPPAALNIRTGTTASIGGGALLAGACTAETQVTITGATTSMAVAVSPATGASPGANVTWAGRVSAADTVQVKVCEGIAGTPTAMAYNVRVLP